MGDFGDAATKVSRLRDEMEDGFERATEQGMETVGRELTRALEAQGSEARPFLKTQTDPTHSDGKIRSVIRLPPWARYLESGTGQRGRGGYPAPSNPPYAEIREWAHQKPIVPDGDYDIDTAAAFIAQSIAEKGTEPHPFIAPVWNSGFGRENIIANNRAALKKAVSRTF